MSEIVIVMVMMTLSWQGRNGSLIKIQLHVLKYLLQDLDRITQDPNSVYYRILIGLYRILHMGYIGTCRGIGYGF